MLKGKIALITGAGRGLGRAMAEAMSREDAKISMVSRSMHELKAAADKIRGYGGSVLEIKGDISNEASVLEMVSKTKEAFSTVDILVNNAAVIGPAKIIITPRTLDWYHTLNVNLMGAYRLILSVLPMMIKQKSGKIINITSGLGQRPYPRFCAYGVSKAGLIQLTHSLSEELREWNIQVNAINPGVMNTHMQSEIRKFGETTLGSEVYQRFHMLYEQGMLKDPKEIAPLAVFLASAKADHLTGHNGTPEYYKHLGFEMYGSLNR
jgi:NAD(P)-dependent dehydrogenase (short-subunit alcohol dehydrogenase family)